MALLNRVDSFTQELLDAQTHIWSHIFNFINSMSLRCAIQLGIPDTIHNHGKPMTLSQLADTLTISKEKSHGLYRLMRILTHSKFFDKVHISKDEDEEEDEEAYRLIGASRLLLKDEHMNVALLALLETDPILVGPWYHVSEWIQNEDVSSFVTKHGKALWEHGEVDQRFNKLFNEAMASDSRLVNSTLVKECRHVFEGLKSMVDVGGGTGEMAKGFTDAFPGLTCTVLDLPHVVDRLEGSQSLSFVGGDMLHDSIPQADAIFLKWVLHIFNDEDCVKVLKKCKESISKNNGGKVIVVEMVVGDQKDDRMATEAQLFFDMQMMLQVAGKRELKKSGLTSSSMLALEAIRSLVL